MRYASLWNKRDRNEPEILVALAKMGVPFVTAGPLDLWCYISSRWIPCEIKQPKGRLTKGQHDFTQECQVSGRPYAIWRSVDDAIAEVNKWRSRA